MLATGKYRLKRRLAIGGMAEVFLASQVGEAGFERPVIIKKTLPGLADDPEFVSRLVDEGLLAVRLSHANIVQTLDLGRLGPDYFIAMEFVDGPDLRDVLKRARIRGFRIPPSIAVYIIWQVARALSYVHEKRDNKGEHLHIVHRDVSPANILLSWEGAVKLADFGIAKAARKLSVTVPGVVQGKFAYMSPEQSEGHDLDARSDVFSLGVVAYEVLCSARPFEGDSDLKTLENIRTMPSPDVRCFRPELPSDLVDTLHRCMAKDPEQRFSSGIDLERNLAGILQNNSWVVTEADVADFLATLYGSETGKGPNGDPVDVDAGPVASVPISPEEMLSAQWGYPIAEKSGQLRASSEEGTRSIRMQMPGHKTSRPLRLALALTPMLLVALGLGVWANLGSADKPNPESAPSTHLAAADIGAANEVADVVAHDQVQISSTSLDTSRPSQPSQAADSNSGLHSEDGTNASDRASSDRPVVVTGPFAWNRLALTSGQKTLATVRSSASLRKSLNDLVGSRRNVFDSADEPKRTVTQITTLPPLAMVSVDGNEPSQAPVTVICEPGSARRIRITADGYDAAEFVISHPAPRKLHKTLEQSPRGTLYLRYFPASATVRIDGRVVHGDNGLNIVNQPLPAGPHRIVVSFEGREVSETVNIEKDKEWRGTLTVAP